MLKHYLSKSLQVSDIKSSIKSKRRRDNINRCGWCPSTCWCSNPRVLSGDHNIITWVLSIMGQATHILELDLPFHVIFTPVKFWTVVWWWYGVCHQKNTHITPSKLLRTASVVVPATIDAQDHVGCATLVVTSNLSYQINIVKKKLRLPATEVVFLNLYLQKCFVSKLKLPPLHQYWCSPRLVNSCWCAKSLTPWFLRWLVA